jgi:hypothetical protein
MIQAAVAKEAAEPLGAEAKAVGQLTEPNVGN